MDIVKNPIISASRRTDIPAFLMDWTISNIQQKYAKVVNPFNRSQISKISLDPKDVTAWVWWSKNFSPWIDAYTKFPVLFTQYPIHIFNFTINSLSELESGLDLPLDNRFQQLQWLLDTFGKEQIQVRFDPIVFYKKSGQDSIYNNLSDFEYIISQISRMGIYKLIFSFAEVYSKVKKRMLHRGKEIQILTVKQKKEEVDILYEICNQYNVSMYACCQPDLVGYKGIQQAHCIDGELIHKLSNGKLILKRDTGQREHCGCQKSRDIGGYSGIFKCRHNCDYCYANPTRK